MDAMIEAIAAITIAICSGIGVPTTRSQPLGDI